MADGDVQHLEPPDARAALLVAGHDELTAQGDAAHLSLRAITRRAGLSHSAPKHHFHDRQGLLTALAVQGFDELHERLRDASAHAGDSSTARRTSLGRAYVDFGLQQRALFDLMFRSDQLDPEDPALVAAQERALGVLEAAVDPSPAPGGAGQRGAGSPAVVAWVFVHGLVTLVRDGTLQRAAGRLGSSPDEATLVRSLTDAFTAMGEAASARPE